MKKEILIPIIIILVLVIGIILFFVLKNKTVKNPKEMEVPIRLTAGIPYKWVYTIEDESIVKFKRYVVVKDENTDGRSGGHVYMNYIFEGLKEGTTKIELKYISLENENDVYDHVELEVKVDKDLNISEVEE